MKDDAYFGRKEKTRGGAVQPLSHEVMTNQMKTK